MNHKVTNPCRNSQDHVNKKINKSNYIQNISITPNLCTSQELKLKPAFDNTS